jgi:chromate transporter
MTDSASSPATEASTPRRLWELAALFLRLGSTAFGGPAVHVAMMHDEVVERRRWISEQRFLDLLGATNLVPGPNSTEMAIHVGFMRAGWPGLIVAGASFIVPAMLIVLVLAWAYVRYGTTTVGEALLYGITPVVIAIVVRALAKLGRTAIKRSVLLVGVGVAVFALYLLRVNEIVLLVGAGVIVLAVRWPGRRRPAAARSFVPMFPGFLSLAATAEAVPVELWRVFLQFLKFGFVVYGSGYVLFAFLQGDLVDKLGWITQKQLVDALAIGQLTPGPVFTTATFIGYLLGGVAGGLVATLGIFLPAFLFVALIQPIVNWIRRSSWAGDALDGVNVGAIGLMAGVSWQLGREAIVDVPTALLALGAMVVLFRFRLNPGWLVGAGAVAGLLITWAR